MTHERCKTWRHLALYSGEGLNSAAVEDLALDRAGFEDPALGRIQLVETGRKHGAQRGRDLDLATRLVSYREHFADEQRVTATASNDLLTQIVRDLLSNQRFDLVAGERLESNR